MRDDLDFLKFKKKKFCRFCEGKKEINYKDVDMLDSLITTRGKIVPRRLTGVCARHQRKVAQAVKRARAIALLPFTTDIQR